MQKKLPEIKKNVGTCIHAPTPALSYKVILLCYVKSFVIYIAYILRIAITSVIPKMPHIILNITINSRLITCTSLYPI